MRRVLGIVGRPLNGVGYVRFAQPFRHLGGSGYELRTLGRQLPLEQGPRGLRPARSLLDGVDAVAFPQLVASPTLADGSQLEVVRPICEDAMSRGLPIIYSIDDDVRRVDRINPAFDQVRGSLDNLETILRHAAAVFVTTETLRRAFVEPARSIFVLPNAVDPARWRARPRSSGELRVGWAGSASHLEDLLMVLPAIRQLQRRVGCRFLVLGLVHRPLAEEADEVRRLLPGLRGASRERGARFLDLVGSLSALRYEHLPFTDIDGYFELLPGLDLDIGICPLLDTEFNRHKSALKFYEYAMCGSLTVASAVSPYIEELSTTVPNDPAAWSDALERWLRDDRAYERELARQRSFVMSERDITKIRTQWAAALDATLPLAGERPRAGAAAVRGKPA